MTWLIVYLLVGCILFTSMRKYIDIDGGISLVFMLFVWLLVYPFVLISQMFKK